MKIVALVGEPATGKTTVARALLQKLCPGIPFTRGLVFGTEHPREKVLVLGEYRDGVIFGGTDRFSMAVQPKAEFLLAQWVFQYRGWTVFFEGDRLGSGKFLDFCRSSAETKIFILKADDSTKTVRHSLRGNGQSSTFLKGRKTKVANIEGRYADAVVLENNSDEQLQAAVASIHAELIRA